MLAKYFKEGLFMFSTKVFGSFSFALVLYQLTPNASIDPLLRFTGMEIPLDWNITGYILFIWVITSIFLGVFGHILTQKTGINEGEGDAGD
jgi:hypothetical protein